MLYGYVQNIKRIFIWISRIGYCRGFGIHSPWAYRMVRYVINEHYPYYAYEILDKRFPKIDIVTRKLCKLCLRLVTCLQPRVVVCVGDNSDVFAEYINAGCRKSMYIATSADVCSDDFKRMLDRMGGADFIRIVPQGNFYDLFHVVCNSVTNGSMIMLHDIYSDSYARRLWRYIVKDLHGVVTFDLYYCGLVFFDDKRYKKNYIINF